ncbi:MAG: hypothetical protein JWN32_3077, partial [Solirubrobacterales bacterium]|nr:hypothetical protein [Solirubrobacterales bacterium]
GAGAVTPPAAAGVFAMALPERLLAGGTTPPLRAPERFDLVGLEWASPGGAHVQLRARRAGGGWSRWVEATVNDGHGPDGATERLLTDPIWTGPSDEFQVRSAEVLHDARLHFVRPTRTVALAARTPLASPVLPAGPGQPRILARAAWSAGTSRPSAAPGYGAIELAFVHHTETANTYSAADVPAMIRSIFHFHRDVRGWHDIGYNFLVDRFGRVYEGRAGGIDEAVVGAQAGGYNLVSTGVAVLGTFESQPPGATTLDALARLLAWKLALHGIAPAGQTTVRVNSSGAVFSRYPANAHVRLSRISGHRDGDSTVCPGTALYRRLPRLRSKARNLAPRVAACAITTPGPQVTYPAPTTVRGQLTILGGTPITNAALEIQGRDREGETTLVQTVTDAGGGWSAELALPNNGAVRALFRGDGSNPAVVSPTLYVLVAPAISLQTPAPTSVPGAAVQVSGQVQPPKPRVRVVVSRLAPDGTAKQVQSTKLTANQGSFATSLRLTEPGQYAIVARTAADATNAAGAAPPILLTVA